MCKGTVARVVKIFNSPIRRSPPPPKCLADPPSVDKALEVLSEAHKPLVIIGKGKDTKQFCFYAIEGARNSISPRKEITTDIIHGFWTFKFYLEVFKCLQGLACKRFSVWPFFSTFWSQPLIILDVCIMQLRQDNEFMNSLRKVFVVFVLRWCWCSVENLVHAYLLFVLYHSWITNHNYKKYFCTNVDWTVYSTKINSLYI